MSFNSTLVRLKGGSRLLSKLEGNEFQFHTGSIKSRTSQCQSRIGNHRFNSTLVRLKVGNVRKEHARVVSFNSTLVRLKVWRMKQRKRQPKVSIPHWFD